MNNTIESSILAKYKATGTSSGGVQESSTVVNQYLNRVMSLSSNFKGHAMPSVILAAIALRESRCGALLDVHGYGDSGHAYGICQIDKRYHIAVGAPESVEHISQCDSILMDFLSQVSKKHQNWPEERQLQGAIAAYNVGVSNIQTIEGIDVGTTHDDYSNDVWSMATTLIGLI